MKIITKNELMEKPITLNGKKAYLRGRLLDFPKVITLDGLHSIEFAWETAEHIINKKGGCFTSNNE